ncbi:thioesterase family protein [Parasalinivibrio latis]|uniref:thioesterase family protein n=1 Tax=Parasalinivibrio latis TaxID=2952610 RepID=UPI0030DE2E9A
MDLNVVFTGNVRQEWIDYNGHMNDACYVSVFSLGIDNFILQLGMDETYRNIEKCSIFTLQSMVHYLQEASENDPLIVTAQLLEHDEKKLRVFFTMRNGTSGDELAAMETLLMHIDMENHRSAPFRPEIAKAVDKVHSSHATHPVPSLAGRAIALSRKKTSHQ